MNLPQLVKALKNRRLNRTADFFESFKNDDTVTLDGIWIDKGMVERHIGPGQLMLNLEVEVTTWVECVHVETDLDFKFTFETEQEQFDAEFTGYIESYDCVRVELRHPNGGIIDYPVKNREALKKNIEFHGDSIVKIYQTEHSYDIQDYL